MVTLPRSASYPTPSTTCRGALPAPGLRHGAAPIRAGLPRAGVSCRGGAQCRPRHVYRQAAQAAHALWAIWLQAPGPQRARFVDEGLGFCLRELPAESLSLGGVIGIDPSAYGTEPDVVVYAAIHDAGWTEVEPGSLTVVGVMLR